MRSVVRWQLWAALLVCGCGPESVTFSMVPENDSGQSGAAVLTERDGAVEVRVSLAAGNAEAEEPAHIHEGRCGKLGAIHLDLSSIKNGLSETVLSGQSLASLGGGKYCINVHSAKATNLYASCGNLP